MSAHEDSMKCRVVFLSAIFLITPYAAYASKLLSFDWPSGKGRVEVILNGRTFSLIRGEFRCKAQVENSAFYSYGPAQFRLTLKAITSGCEQVLGRNQLIDIELSNFDPQKKTAYPPRVIARMHDEAKQSESGVNFLNSDLLRAAYKESAK